MAPPPSPDLPLPQRLQKLASTLQFAWFAGHAALILCITRYAFSWLRFNYYSGMARFCYRTAFIAAAGTYGIVVYKTWRARQKTGAKQPGGPVGYLSDENVQYLLMALVWLLLPQYPLALLPYGIYSVFHVATYTRANLIPTLFPPQKVAPTAGAAPNGKPQYAPHPLSDAIGVFVKKYYDMSMSMVSSLEILLWVRVLLAAIFFQYRSWVLLVLYTVFLRARYAQSSHVQNSFAMLEARIDNLVGAQGTPPAARQAWDVVKNGARQFHAATDISNLPSSRITMASLLRQIVAGPRVKHQDTGLDLCYVTKDIIATSGPSQTYPQRAYRNPLDRLVAFLDAKHGENWAIWEFRAEGTGYPDEAVYGRIRHFPWPDHHPPPFGLVPLIVGGMKSWLSSSEEEKKRVVVVHCKAGKGRSGTMACSYLIAECGWTAEDALARFTERRMRPGFGAGVSIPSQLRWVSYVDRWTKGGKKPYIDREVEILEVHIWGLRNGVKVEVEGFAEEGKKIKVFHTFGKEERIVVEAGAPGGGGVVDFARDVTGFGNGVKGVDDTGEVCEEGDFEGVKQGTEEEDGKGVPARSSSLKGKGQRAADKVMRKLSTKKTATTTSTAPPPGLVGKDGRKSKTISMPDPTAAASSSSDASALPGKDELRSQSTASLQNAGTFTFADSSEPGGQAVIFKPAKPIRVPNSDINISVERRNKAPGNIGLTMVTAVAHVWFNVFFEGNGPEKYGKPDDSGVFDIDWDKMDGIKGSSQRGTRACDRLSVVWRVVGGASQRNEEEGTGPGIVINEPADADSVPQMQAADWKGANTEDPAANKHLGLRVEDPASASVSKASSVKSEDNGKEGEVEEDEVSLEGVKVSGPTGEEVLDDDVVVQAPVASGDQGVSAKPEVGDKTAKNGFSQKQ
ncbi:nucleoporin POM33 [Podospora australis]|uniref:phosphatidylinositol-3,4,5-trisphosphate 3-phosphatase n=1 Tax=Podospora australis TaxID=1536484 RepID=A0AAN6WNK1_9PEZI|nr:nucleoporin POM33 [Podospora australis]